MYVNQISVFLENATGSLSRLLRLLAKNDIDLIALSIADTAQFGIMRCIVSDTERALAVIKEAGYVARLTEVLAVSVADRPGGLSEVLTLLNAAEISVEYLYSFVRNAEGKALVIFRLSDNEKGARVLSEGDVTLLGQAQVERL